MMTYYIIKVDNSYVSSIYNNSIGRTANYFEALFIPSLEGANALVDIIRNYGYEDIIVNVFVTTLTEVE